MKRALQIMTFAACISAVATCMAQPPDGGRGGPRGHGGPGGLGGGGPMQHLLDTFDEVDTNMDGMLSKAELQAAISRQPQGGRGRPGGPGDERRGPGGPRDHAGPGGPRDHDGPGGPRDHDGPGGPREHAGPGGPRDHAGPGGPREQRGAPPRPGIVLPEFLVQSLGLSSEQKDKLAALQKEVDTQLAAILTDEQKKEMENHQPPHHGPGHGEGGREGGPINRPQRPQ